MTKNKANILGCYIDIIDNKDAIKRVEQIIQKGSPAQVITLNAEIVYAAKDDARLQAVINTADLVTPDGIGIVWAANKMGYSIKERVTGIDMVYNICALAAARGYQVYLLGAAPGVAEQAAQNLMRIYPGLNVCGWRDGYFKEEEAAQVIQGIRSHKPDIIFAALGAPKQEFFINQYKEELGIPLCMGVGGSFDVIAGVKKRAPRIMIKLNLEWLYRLVSEPSRIKRQAVLPRFVLAVLRERYFGKR